MIRRFFVTGTDTDCGKTLVTLAYMLKLAQSGSTVYGMKPVAAGASRTAGGLRNADALAIRELCTGKIAYQRVNPYCFEPPVAPHLAAEQAGEIIRLSVLSAAYADLSSAAEAVVVEGVGGWRVPLGDELDVAGLCSALQLPAILVVGMRLGCLNHALLSAEAIRQSGVQLAGWVANQSDPAMQLSRDNVRSLVQRIDAPLLGEIPFLPGADYRQAAQFLELPT